ncbi:cyclin-dependent kinase inhibitor 1-like [Dendrobium catenatum]|uniref:cyclin-dependent kinase inhibitor 1-like n=1 Tax=Dendrobium catenatum TaxID=906689 RepID=UPI0009F22A22|nr:cyclin-dependent kinase inhibitor 1-like [Dendrobium catenatum]
MVKCMKKCRRITKVAVMEVTQVVGMRTRARSLALAAAAELRVSRKRKAGRSENGELQMAYLKLRSRSLVMTHRDQSKLAGISDGRICGNGERIISRCSSSSSCEAVDEDVDILFPRVRVHTPCEDVASRSMCKFEFSGDRREMSLSIYSGELESSAERISRQSKPEFRTPPASEIEEFFTAAEKSEKHRFATRYNFDVDKEVPLEGRYEWVRINP